MVELGVNFGYHVSPRMKSRHSQMEYNWRDIQRKNFVNNVDMSRLRAPWQNYLETTIFLCFSDFYFLFYLNCLKWILQEMLSYRLGTVNDFHWKFKPVLSYSRPHTFPEALNKKYFTWNWIFTYCFRVYICILCYIVHNCNNGDPRIRSIIYSQWTQGCF